MQFFPALAVISILSTPSRSEEPKVVTAKLLIGLWQAGTSRVSSGFLETYRFFPDGTFTFGFSQYTQPIRFIKLHGKYSLQGKFITFRITHRTDWVGGKIVRGGPPADTEWIVAGGKSVTIKQSSNPEDPVEISLISQPGSQDLGITIEGYKYFKISNDPKDQDIEILE